MISHFTKTTALAIALLACNGCMVIPVPIPIPIPISNDQASPSRVEAAAPDCLTSLPNVGIRKDESSEDVEAQADKLEAQGKGQEALNKYSEARTLYFGELGWAAGRALGHGDISAVDEINTSVESPEFLFKLGRAYAKTRKHQVAISCFSQSLDGEIEQPNDASAYLNRGEAYLATGEKEKARQDYQKSADLFQQYKLPQYKKMATDRLGNATP
jgi:tetratricopeptide (TPR) repeat protein